MQICGSAHELISQTHTSQPDNIPSTSKKDAAGGDSKLVAKDNANSSKSTGSPPAANATEGNANTTTDDKVNSNPLISLSLVDASEREVRPENPPMTTQLNHGSNAATETPNSDHESEDPAKMTSGESPLPDNETTEVEEATDDRTSNAAKSKRKRREEYKSDDDGFEGELDEGDAPGLVEDLEEQKEEEVAEMYSYPRRPCQSIVHLSSRTQLYLNIMKCDTSSTFPTLRLKTSTRLRPMRLTDSCEIIKCTGWRGWSQDSKPEGGF